MSKATTRITVRIPAALKAKIARLSSQQKKTMTQFVIDELNKVFPSLTPEQVGKIVGKK